MRKIFSYITILSLLLSSCVHDVGLELDEVLKVSSDSFEFESAEGSEEFLIESYCSWNIKCDADWVTFSSDQSGKGKVKNILSVQKNGFTEDRSAVAEIYNKEFGVNIKIDISQKAGAPYIKSSNDTIEVPFQGDTKNITIESNVSWSVSCSSAWVTFSPSSGEIGESALNIVVAENIVVEPREAVITIVNTEYGITKEITVSQVAFVPELKLSREKLENISYNGSTENIVIESNISWSVSCSSAWVTFSPSSGEIGESALNIVVAENIVVEPREAVITIVNTEYGITKEITVSQVAFVPELKLSREKLENISYNGSTENITVESNIPWIASCSSAWVTFSPLSGGVGESTMRIMIAENTSVAPREAIVAITNAKYGITKEITVSQVAFVPELKLSREKLENISYNGSIENITIESNVSWSVSCLSEWVQITPLSGGKGGTSMVVAIQENSVEESREAEILVVNEEYGIIEKVVVSQNKWTPNINGYEYVDLGLPSGLKWATCNVGANSPEEYGDYYAWGEVNTKSDYSSSNSVTFGKSMSDISGNPTYDVARKKWGSSWRLPTKAEFQELLNECNWQSTTQGGKRGYKVTGPNGNSIFLPAAGYRFGSSLYRAGEYGSYWSSSPYESGDFSAYYLYFNSSDHDVSWNGRNYGRSVRPVSE